MATNASVIASNPVAGLAAAALASLTPSQITFLQSLPKAELHAHLNGSIPLPVLKELAEAYLAQPDQGDVSETVRTGVDKLLQGVVLAEIHDFFALFPAIYALTATPDALARVTRAVLDDFLSGDKPQCTYLELRTTPKHAPHMSRRDYLSVVLDVVEKFPPERAALIVSLDRRMGGDDMREVVDLAIALKAEGRRVVGVDLCGDPLAGDAVSISEHVRVAKAGGLGVTLHIAETTSNTAEDSNALLSARPDRLGHATFLDITARELVVREGICVEICLTSNLLCKTVPVLDDHHVRYYLERNHPVAICTDDSLPFRTSLLAEYALLLAASPLGLGLAEAEVRRVAQWSVRSRFGGRI